MNDQHLRLCASPEWAQYVEETLLPWALADHDLGDDVLEVGPGPGLTTDVLRRRVTHLTVVEIDGLLASKLAGRLSNTRVEVVQGDATSLAFDSGRFSAATSFTMLHHVPSAELQDRVLRELRRVLRAGGILVGSDATDTPARRELHAGDTFVPVNPVTLAGRLVGAGFEQVVVEESDEVFRFLAKVPARS